MAALCMARKCTRFPVSPRIGRFFRTANFTLSQPLVSSGHNTLCVLLCVSVCQGTFVVYRTHTHHLLHYWTSPSSVLFVCLSQIQKDHFFVRLFFFTFTPTRNSDSAGWMAPRRKTQKGDPPREFNFQGSSLHTKTPKK